MQASVRLNFGWAVVSAPHTDRPRRTTCGTGAGGRPDLPAITTGRVATIIHASLYLLPSNAAKASLTLVADRHCHRRGPPSSAYDPLRIEVGSADLHSSRWLRSSAGPEPAGLEAATTQTCVRVRWEVQPSCSPSPPSVQTTSPVI